jgi:hypothetical protein
MRHAITVVFLMLLPLSLGAQDDDVSRASLWDWHVVGVQVKATYFSPVPELAGDMEQRLQTDVELRLREAGLRVNADARGVLRVHAGAFRQSNGVWEYRVMVSVQSGGLAAERVQPCRAFDVACRLGHDVGLGLGREEPAAHRGRARCSTTEGARPS